ncbi:TRAP transporter permease [Salicibibacter kimchii]|uniref:TRAP transporter permease n=1 Tax=Salicibibacter kimchii TaxID=2099786 RepID=A0A345BXP2_9BACI|nr:TRAP transporter permease [Salicibibacter kimchii]AXF55723.1 TRAP transporter permease [Salicibibacter kimchii]
MADHTQNDDVEIDEQEKREIIEKYDKESNNRYDLGKWVWIVAILGISLTSFHLYTGFSGSYGALIQGAIHLGSALSLIYILYPINRKAKRKPGVPWYDALLSIISLFSYLYVVWHYDRLVSDVLIFGFEPLDLVVSLVAIVLLLEATRRAVGMPIVIIAILALLYGVYGHASWLGVFSHAGFSWTGMSTQLLYSTEAIFGTPIQVSSTFIFLFLFFGVLLVRTNIGQFFNDIAFRLTGRYTGGTAKAAVAASGLQGMVTGSSVANTVGSGSFTIPMMKRAGFKPEFAGAAEATASTGGQLMPPIMGAAAFIMAEYVGIPYNELIVYAIIPAALYFLGAFLGIHFNAKKDGIVGVPKSELPSVASFAKRFDMIIPLVTIIGLLLAGYTPTYAALWGIGAAFAISFLRKDTRLGLLGILQAMEQGARVALPVIAACASAGIIVGIVVFTGLGGVLANGIIQIAGGNFFLVLFLTMIACIILGMGLPTTANYVVTASVAAPAILAFDVPPVAAHMFVFYFGIVADITPPVCLAAYAGAGIARANPMRTGVNAFKLAIAAFIIPYAFVANPVMVLQGDWTLMELATPLLTAIIGMAAVSASLMGYFFANSMFIERIIIFAAGIMAIYPIDVWISLAGVAILVIIAVIQHLRKKKQDQDPTPSTT